jgi:hypothetical protein
MRMSPALLAAVSLACALPQGVGEPLSVPVSVRSHNRSSVDVYLLCGNRDAEWLGVVHGKHGELFDIPASRAWCIRGLNFFLVHRDMNRGYWVGPVRLRRGSTVHLTIEKYAGLSAARVGEGFR